MICCARAPRTVLVRGALLADVRGERAEPAAAWDQMGFFAAAQRRRPSEEPRCLLSRAAPRGGGSSFMLSLTVCRDAEPACVTQRENARKQAGAWFTEVRGSCDQLLEGSGEAHIMEAQDARTWRGERGALYVLGDDRPKAREMVCMLLGTFGFHHAAAETREINSSKD